MECSSIVCNDSSPFTVALRELEALARDNSFTIHDVPYDGNCMFSAIAYQLQSSGICNIESHELRQMVVNYLEANSASYQDFISQPVVSHYSYNADTESPTAEDAYIDTIAHPELHVQLRWERYLIRLRDGAWGDHITMYGIANMLGVTINVLCSQDSNVLSVTPSNCNTQNEVYLCNITM